MKAINRSIAVAIFVTIAGVALFYSCGTSKSRRHHSPTVDTITTVVEADTFPCYTKYIKVVNVAGSKVSVVYDDADAGYSNQVMMVTGSDAKYLVDIYYGQDVNTNLVIIQTEYKCIIKTK